MRYSDCHGTFSLMFIVVTNFQHAARECQTQLIPEMKRHISHWHVHGESCHLPSPHLGRAFQAWTQKRRLPSPLLSSPSISLFDWNKNTVRLYWKMYTQQKVEEKKRKSNLLFNVFEACLNLSVEEEERWDLLHWFQDAVWGGKNQHYDLDLNRLRFDASSAACYKLCDTG